MAVIQPNADSVHGIAEGTARLSFDLHNERGEAGAWGLSVGAVSLTGRTNGVRYLTLAAADGQNCSVAMFIMPSMRAEKYRQEAARLRCEAERAKHPDIRRQLLNIATEYDDLANSVERLLQSN